MTSPPFRESLKTVQGASLLALYAFTAMAVIGYGVYGRHPELIPQTEFGLRVFSVSFPMFARLHIVIAALVMAAVLLKSLGWRWVLPFVAVYSLSFAAEHIGTGYGVPFGGYEYTGLLGPKLGGRVPFLIPISWFLMAIPSWVIARHAFDGRRMAVGRITLGALWLTIWDLALDPAMSFLTPYWMWEETGSYYGMPAVNLLGWLVTGLALMGVIEAFSRRVAWETLNLRWMVGYYLAMVAMPLGMLVAAGLWLGVLVTGLAVAAGGAATIRLAAGRTAGLSPSTTLGEVGA
jgi:putative membrane protein